MSVQNIYNLLRAAGVTHAGACGLMGNMQAESGMRANNAQNSYVGNTDAADEAYTAAVDAGTRQFVGDSIGYGLCQWTYWSRKKGLLDYAKLRGTSVGDETTQVLYCIKELRENYSSVWQLLCSTDDVYEATSEVCKRYERPAHNNIDTRYYYAQQFQGLAIQTEETAEEPVEEQETAAESFPVLWPPRTIQEGRGFDGAEVALVWALLRCRGLTDFVSDRFAPELTALVKTFQHSQGLDADGIVGPNTWAALLRRG